MKNGLKKGNSTTRMMLTPYSLWAVIFIIVPLLFIAYYAFTDNNFNFTFENISRFFTAVSQVKNPDGTFQEVRTYLVIFVRSLKLAAVSTAVCLTIGYPIARQITVEITASLRERINIIIYVRTSVTVPSSAVT